MKVFNKFEIFMLHYRNSQMTKNVKEELQKWSLQELFRKRNSRIYVRVTMLQFDLDLLSTSSGMEDPASSLRIHIILSGSEDVSIVRVRSTSKLASSKRIWHYPKFPSR